MPFMNVVSSLPFINVLSLLPFIDILSSMPFIDVVSSLPIINVLVFKPIFLLQVIEIEDSHCIMLPPNATSLIQPLDQGIIAMAKSRYRKWYLTWLLAQDNLANGIVDADEQAPSDSDEERDNEVVPLRQANTPVHHIKASVRRGIRKLSRVWRDIEPIHIWNCWRKAEIVPREWYSLYDAPADALMEREYNELGALIGRVHHNPQRRMNAIEYVHDVCGENEREAVNEEEDRSPTVSQASSSRSRNVPAQVTSTQLASPSIGSTACDLANASTPLSLGGRGYDSQESRTFFPAEDSSEWDDIQCGQDLLFTDLVDLDLNV